MIEIKETKKGFTIIELAVVLVVIGVIVLIALGAYKGVRGTKAHVQWQTIMDDAYNTLIDNAYQVGRFPVEQAEFDELFIKSVDDYSFGGTVIYENVDPNIYDHAITSFKAICALTNNDILNDNHIVFTLKEKSRGSRPGKLADRNVTLADIQASLKCLPSESLYINESVLPLSIPDRNYQTSVAAYGGDKFSDETYQWCVEVAAWQDLKCSASSEVKTVNLANFFKELQSVGVSLGEPSYPFTNDCMSLASSSWTKSKHFNLKFKRGDKRTFLGAESIPFKVYVRDAHGKTHSRNFNFTNASLYELEIVGSACNL